MFDFLILNPQKRAAHKRKNDEAERIEAERIADAKMIENLWIIREAKAKYEEAYEAAEQKLMACLPVEQIIPLLAFKKEYGTDLFRQYLFERNGHQYHPFTLEEWLEK
jgi:hypothetical protein